MTDNATAAANAAYASANAAASSTAAAAGAINSAVGDNVDTAAIIAQANAAAAAAKAAAEAARAAMEAGNTAAAESAAKAAAPVPAPAAKTTVNAVIKLACPSCGAPLPLDDTSESVACAYCGAHLRVSRRTTEPAKPVEPPKPTAIKDPSSGKPLAYVMLPEGYSVSKAALDATRPTCDFPFAATFELTNGSGAVIRYHSGERYYQYSGLLATQVSQFNPKVKQRNFATAEEFLDAYAAAFGGGKAQVYVVGQCDLPLYQPVSLEESRRRIVNDALAEIARSDTYSFEPMKLAGVYFDTTCRIYDVMVNGKSLLRLGLGCYLEAVNCTGPSVAGAMLGMGGLGALGGLLGGLLGGNSSGGLLGSLFGGAKTQANIPSVPAAAAAASADSKFFAFNQQTGTLYPTTRAAFSQVSGYGGLGWTVRHIFMLMAPPASFDAELTGAFKEVCSSVKISDYVYDRWAKAAEADAQALRQKTQMTLQQQQAQFEAMQAFNRAQQQAFDSYQQAWWDRENSTWAANRARDRAAASSVSTADKWSEAIRGVNTYVRPDGSEVQVSVSADTAWTNASGDVLGGSSTFNPGSGWTQMDRKW